MVSSAAMRHYMPGLTYLEISLCVATKMVDFLHDRAPQTLKLIGHWVESWLNCPDDSIHCAAVLMAHVDKEHPGDLAVELILLILVHWLMLAIIVASVAAVETRVATARVPLRVRVSKVVTENGYVVMQDARYTKACNHGY